MQFIVENGEGLDNATSYVTVEYVDDYIEFVDVDSEWIDMDDEEKQLRIMQATEYVDNLLIWTSQLKSTDQSLNFPRNEFNDKQGRTIAADSVPSRIKQAVAVVTHTGLSQDIYDEGALLSSEIYGKSSETYYKPQRVGGSVELRNLKQTFLRLGYGRSGSTLVEIQRS